MINHKKPTNNYNPRQSNKGKKKPFGEPKDTKIRKHKRAKLDNLANKITITEKQLT